eukprot:147831-Amphidinium_carterae.2
MDFWIQNIPPLSYAGFEVFYEIAGRFNTRRKKEKAVTLSSAFPICSARRSHNSMIQVKFSGSTEGLPHLGSKGKPYQRISNLQTTASTGHLNAAVQRVHHVVCRKCASQRPQRVERTSTLVDSRHTRDPQTVVLPDDDCELLRRLEEGQRHKVEHLLSLSNTMRRRLATALQERTTFLDRCVRKRTYRPRLLRISRSRDCRELAQLHVRP